MRADVVVIGAGPAGCSAALVLVRAGARVVIAERRTLPAAKVCGDGLLPDAVRSLSALGLEQAVREAGHPVTGIRFPGSAGHSLTVPLEGVVLRRDRLDALLLDAAQAAGAELLTGATLEGFRRDGERVVAVRLATQGGRLELPGTSFVLATGAAAGPRLLAGLATYRSSGPIAIRGYLGIPDLPEDDLLIAVRRDLSGGYSWAFPLGEGLWNVGCGLAPPARRPGRMRDALARFAASLGGGEWIGRVRGAPLASWFPALRVTKANLATVGDAAGLTLPFCGEGVGPALLSGMMAARHLVEAPGSVGVEAYRRALVQRLAREYRAWRFGELFLRFPRLAALVFSKAHHSGAVRRLSELLAGTRPAARILTPVGLARLFLQR